MIGVGLIGYGLGGRAFHAPYVMADSDLTLRAVVSRDPAKVHADLAKMRVVPSVEALLREPGIDLVIVCSPDALHAEHAIAALRAGKHVVVDKPFTTSLADAREVVRTAMAVGRLLTVFHNRRWDADFLTLQALLADGRLGQVIELESRLDRWRPVPSASWKDARAGGAWLDLGPHLIDQVLVLFGPPHAITADIAGLRSGTRAPDYFHAVLRYADKRVAVHSSKLVAANSLRFAVHGTKGSWIKHGVDPQEASTVAGRVPGGPDWGADRQDGLLTFGGGDSGSVPWPNRRGDYQLFWRKLAAAIHDEALSPVLPSEALLVMEVLDAGLRSAAQRVEVVL